MGNVLAVFQKEIRSYFGSPIAYVMAGVFLLFMGYNFRSLVLYFNQVSMTFMQQGPQVQRASLNVNDVVVRSFFGLQFFIWMIVTPMLTMRLYAEEKKTGTIELLMTSPLTTWHGTALVERLPPGWVPARHSLMATPCFYKRFPRFEGRRAENSVPTVIIPFPL